ncbi:MAG: hypothetical protein OEL76_15300 [Siculibacillus sp.]|nr:hypothetical protein [Siculibacillus sp.]
MPEPGLLTSKVRAYMESLSPAARSMLVRSLRSSQAHGDLPSDIILAAVEGLDLIEEPEERQRVRPVGEPWSQRLENAFFAPLTPFVSDDTPSVHTTGRVAASSLPVIWTWIRRDVASEDYERAIAADPYDADADVAPIARKLRREVMARVVDLLRDAGTDPKLRQKLAGQLGGDAVYRDLVDTTYVLHNEAAFANLFGQLPSNITAFDVAEPSRLTEVVRASLDQVQMTADWIAAAMLTRTATPVVVAALATRLAGSADPRLVAASRYAPLVETVIAQLERLANLAQHRGPDTTSRNRFLADVRSYHDINRNLALLMPIEVVPAWMRRIGAAKVAISDVVSRWVEPAPGLVRRALRVETTGGEYAGRWDTAAYEDAEFAVRLSIEARLAAESLAVNELVGRTRKQIEATLEVVSAKLMTDLKSSQSLDKRTLMDAVDGAIRLSALVFGEDYAAVLRKSRDIFAGRTARAAG